MDRIWLRGTVVLTSAIGIALIAVAAATYLMAVGHDGPSWISYGLAGVVTAGMPVISGYTLGSCAGWWRPSPVSRAVLDLPGSFPGRADPGRRRLVLAVWRTHDAVLVFAQCGKGTLFGGVPCLAQRRILCRGVGEQKTATTRRSGRAQLVHSLGQRRS